MEKLYITIDISLKDTETRQEIISTLELVIGNSSSYEYYIQSEINDAIAKWQNNLQLTANVTRTIQ